MNLLIIMFSIKTNKDLKKSGNFLIKLKADKSVRFYFCRFYKMFLLNN